MNAHHQSALFSAAAYLCSAADELRRAGFDAMAEEILTLIAYLDGDGDVAVEELEAGLSCSEDGVVR